MSEKKQTAESWLFGDGYCELDDVPRLSCWHCIRKFGRLCAEEAVAWEHQHGKWRPLSEAEKEAERSAGKEELRQEWRATDAEIWLGGDCVDGLHDWPDEAWRRRPDDVDVCPRWECPDCIREALAMAGAQGAEKYAKNLNAKQEDQ